MAIYHCSLKVFSRSEGHSAVAAAAYRSGSILRDERAGKTHRYQNRSGVADTFILAPPHAPKNLLTRAVLWNAAEASETRKNSRVAREVILALPHELSDKARAELSCDMGLYLIERYRVAVDVAVHSPCEGDGHDPRNHHAHLLFTTREVTKDGLGAKTRILDDKVSGPQEIEIIREVWETLANDALERAGFADAKIDRRTLEDQGVDRIPQTHEGKASKNAAAYESLLAKDFQKADKGDDDDDDESGEEESSGEKSSSSSSSSSSGGGSKSGALTSKEREDDKGRPIDYVVIDKERTRAAFNAEIKALNEKRAAFGDKPLTEQIAQLDRLMERLDKRMEKLQALETKTSLKSVIKQSIASAVKLATDLITNRKEAKAVLKFTAEEKQARTERKLTRYGRDYREGLHTQIKEMKQNIAILEQNQKDFRNYKSFVDKIDMEVKTHSPSIKAPFKEKAPSKQTTDKEVNIKLHLRAEMIRAQIPAQFKPPVKGERQTLTTSTAVNKVLQAKGEPIRIDKAAFAAPKTKPETKPSSLLETRAESRVKIQPARTEAPPMKAAFTSKAETLPTLGAQAEYKQPMPVKIKALEQAIAERQLARPMALKLQPTRAEAPPIKSAFNSKAEIQPTPKAQTEYKQSMPVKIKALEKAISERQTMRVEIPKPEARKSWFTPATDKTKPMTETIDKAIKQQRAAQPSPERPSTQTQEKFSKAQERPQRRATFSEARGETQAEAETKRANVPPSYRAEPYETKTETPKPENKPVDVPKTEPKNAFNTTATTESNPKDAKPRMSNTFNMKSGAQNAEQAPPRRNPDDKPEAEV